MPQKVQPVDPNYLTSHPFLLCILFKVCRLFMDIDGLNCVDAQVDLIHKFHTGFGLAWLSYFPTVNTFWEIMSPT